MKPLTVVLLHHFLSTVFVLSAPAGPTFDLVPAFREASERAKALVEKILKDIPSVHAATVSAQGLTLDPGSQTPNLEMMALTLGIPSAPVLKPLSERFTLDVCISRMASGSHMFQQLLAALGPRLGGLGDLKADLRDLLTHIHKMKAAALLDGGGVEPTSSLDLDPRLHGDYEVQVAAHLTLLQLQSFCHDLIRSLRAVAVHRPRAAGAR
ncbi:uncharacterized protein V6R79_004445 [Siganus canaliculatus]